MICMHIAFALHYTLNISKCRSQNKECIHVYMYWFLLWNMYVNITIMICNIISYYECATALYGRRGLKSLNLGWHQERMSLECTLHSNYCTMGKIKKLMLWVISSDIMLMLIYKNRIWINCWNDYLCIVLYLCGSELYLQKRYGNGARQPF